MEWLLAALAALFGVPAALAWMAQDRLVFFPQPLASRPAAANVEPLEILGADGVRLRGFLRRARASPAPAILYFGGNAEEVSWTMSEQRWPHDVHVIAVNYRGYGESEGAPGERALERDAVAIYDAVVPRGDVARGRIFVMGRSLGTGVAVALAAQRPVAGAVLAAPYDSLVAVGRHHYPLLPVGVLLRHRFDAIARAPAIDAPLLALVAEDDRIVPRARSQALFDAWAGPKSWSVLPGTDHNSISVPDAFWQAVARFLRDQALALH